MVSFERIITNKMLIDDLGLWDEFRINKSKDDPLTQRYYNLISNILDYQLTASRQWLSSPQARAYYLQESEYTKEIFQSLDDEWDDILNRHYNSVDELLDEIYRRGKEKGYKDIKERLIYTEQDKQALDFVRQYNFDLITKLSNDLRKKVKNTITEGVAKGENPYSLANKLVQQGITPLKGSTLTAKQRAVMIPKTEVSRAQNTAILQTYANEGYTEVTILTAEDQHVCRLCLANAYQFNKDSEMVYHEDLKDRTHRISDLDEDSLLPLHPNCRCTYLSVWDSKKDVNSEPDVVNLTPLTQNSLSSKISSKINDVKRKLGYKNLNTIEETSDYFGLKYYGLERQHAWSGNKGKYHKFYDAKNDCTFYISENLCKGRNKCISLNNKGGANYDLKEVLRIYDNAPLLLKQNTTSISFVNRNNGDIIGRHSRYKKMSNEEWESVKDIMGERDDYVEIFRDTLKNPQNSDENLARVMYHEMGHSVDLSWKGGLNLSTNLRYVEAMEKEGLSSPYARAHFMDNKIPIKQRLTEDVAETISMIAFKNNSNKKSAIIKSPDGTKTTYNEFIEKFPEKVKIIEEALQI